MNIDQRMKSAYNSVVGNSGVGIDDYVSQALQGPAQQNKGILSTLGKLGKPITELSIAAVLFSGCAITTNIEGRDQNSPNKRYEVELGKKPDFFSTYLPWNRYIIDRDDFSPFADEVNRVACDEKGVYNSAEPVTGEDIAKRLHEAACVDFSRREISNIFEGIGEEQTNSFGQSLEYTFNDNINGYSVTVNIKKEIGPEAEWVARRILDAGIIYGIKVGIEELVEEESARDAVIPTVEKSPPGAPFVP